MSEIVQKAENYVTDLLTNTLNPDFLYHNLTHTQRVVKNTKVLANHYEIGDAGNENLELAAWFHDTGYTKGVPEHEKSSCTISEAFLKKHDFDGERIREISRLILATERYHNPQNLGEEIIRDADASHFGQRSYMETSELLREELSRLGIGEYSLEEWRDVNIEMLQTEHRFYTDYALENWQPQKDKNIRKLKKAEKERKNIAKKEQLKAKYKSESPERGIQTMYRVTMRNHLKLSDIADTKANILLSVNAIIISLVLANLIPKLDNPSNTYLIYPTVIFIVFSVISMILSILATRPNVTRGEFTKKDVKEKKVNLLFFGNFHKMELKDYEWAIQELVKDKEYVYSSLTKDLYFLGLVLNKKYKILRLTYNIFMIGMIISVIAFGIAFRFFGPDRLNF